MVGTRSTSRAQDGEAPSHTEANAATDPQTHPRRTSTLSAVPTPQTTQADPEREERALQQRLHELQRQERVAQLQRKVKELEERAVAGFPDDSPAEHRRGSATTPTPSEHSVGVAPEVGRVRARADLEDDDPEDAPDKRRRTSGRIRLPDPQKYRARNFKEYLNFIRACEQHFEAYPQQYREDRDKHLFVKVWSEGETQDAIYRRLQREDAAALAWPELKRFLQDLLAPDYERSQEAASAYHGAKQRRDQSVSSFITYLDGLEERLPPVPEEHRVAHLMQALRPEIQTEILSRSDQPTTRAALIEAAVRTEHVLRLRERGPRDERRIQPIARRVETTVATYRANPVRPHDVGRSRTDHTPGMRPPPARVFSGVNQVPLPSRPRNDNRGNQATPRDKSKDACNHCGKLGHWEKDCYSKQNGKPPAGKARAQ
jgi:hypothetical protein